jgi:hypothetical protein
MSPASSDLQGRIIVFRFYNAFDVCRQRLQQLKTYNPDVPIYGLFGGRKVNLEVARHELLPFLEHLYLICHEDRLWKWLHADISLKEWYRDVGRSVAFDYLYDYEFDIATFAPLHELYPPVRPNTQYFSQVRMLTPDLRRRWQWTGSEPDKSRVAMFSEYMQRTFGLPQLDTSILATAPLLSREFVATFAETEDIDWVFSEVSLPAYVRALGFAIADNGFYPGDTAGAGLKFFNPYNEAIEESIIVDELRKPWGRRVFHPVKYLLHQI